MKLSVIIPFYNAAYTIAVQLEALSRQSWSEPWEVIVSDNGSTDESLTIVRRYQERIQNLRIVDSSDRRGASHARNIGVLAAISDALAFCDADDEVGPNWVAAIGEALSVHDFVASRFDTEKLNTSQIQRYKGNPQRDGFQMLWYPPYVPHAASTGLGVKRSVHDAVGGFDESLLALEDTDYCCKIHLAGWRLHFESGAVIHYRNRSKFKSIYRQSRSWAEYNVLLYKRHRPTGMRIMRPWSRYLSDVRKLLQRLPRIRRVEGRAAWIWLLGQQVGRIQGSIKYRVPPV